MNALAQTSGAISETERYLPQHLVLLLGRIKLHIMAPNVDSGLFRNHSTLPKEILDLTD